MANTMSATTRSVYYELMLEGQVCDVMIIVNGKAFNAHKIILCGCSEYFRFLFSSDDWNTERREVNIPGVSPEMMKLIIQYAYTLTVPITPNNVQELLVVANQLAMLDLMQTCCNFLEAQLCIENCIGISQIAELHFCTELHRVAHIYIRHNFEPVAKASEEFLVLSLDQLTNIIEKDDLNVKQEDVVFEAILRWIDHAPSERRGHISVLLPKVRMALMESEYFMTKVKNNELVKQTDECKPIVIDVLKAMYDLNINGLSDLDFCNPMTRPRLPYAILLSIGGWSGESPTNVMEAYDSRANHWVDVTMPEESPRAYHGVAYLKGWVYSVGGFNGMDYFSSVCKFDPVARTWHEAAPMHSQRCYVSVVVLDGFIYAMGGFNGEHRLSLAERYEPETNQWTLITPMNEQRSDTSATTLHGKVYICGGFNGNECLRTSETYSPETNQWTAIAPMSNRRSGVGVIAYENHVYAVGGFDGTNRLRTVEAYNPLTNSWHPIPSMYIPRSNFCIEVVEDCVFVVGGFNGFSATASVECYDKEANEWYDACDMSFSRSALSCCVLPGLPNMADYTIPRDALLPDSLQEETLSCTYSLPSSPHDPWSLIDYH
ncbi:kelch-like protein 10 [Amia ocellicauda]|uniref:kelch-like protein 10 n=1 Tax=Amia ocellicauda TaxID=2972642 RepID=UPI00346397E5